MVLQIALVLLFGMLTAYIDIDSFFREKKISYISGDNFRFWGFLLFNGALSSAFLFWALSSGSDSPINKTVQVESSWAKMFIVGFGVPLLVRSKLFSFGEAQIPAGPALVYDWLRLKTFISINEKSAQKKDKIAESHAASLTGHAGLDNEIKDWVDAYVRPFATSSKQAELDQEFGRIQARYGAAAALNKEHLRTLIRWAMDNTAIDYIEDRLKGLSP